MRKRWIAIACASVAMHAHAGNLQIGRFDPDKLNLDGSQCAFDDQARQTVLASDWVEHFWLKIDGNMVKLTGRRTDAEIGRQLKTKRWRQVVTGQGVTLVLDLVETGRGEDAKGYKGRIEIRQGKESVRVPVAGSCSA
jgi:hypothetical protein